MIDIGGWTGRCLILIEAGSWTGICYYWLMLVIGLDDV